MIQRKQSIYLFLILCIVAFLIGRNPLMYMISGEDKWTGQETGTIEVSVLKIDRILGEETLLSNWNSYLIYALSTVGLLALLALFLFKNRKLQLLLCGFNYLFMLATGALMYVYILEGKSWILLEEGHSMKYSFLVVVILPLWNFLAMRGIMHDEKLVRSMDRLR